MEAQKIIADKPFADKIAVKTLEPVSNRPEGHASGGTAYWVDTEDGKKYKLRACKDEARAIQIGNTIEKLQHMFPKLYGRDRNYLLFDVLSGYRNVTRQELLANVRKIGRMCAEIHQVKEITTHDPEKFFFKRLRWLRNNKSIDAAFYSKIAEAYRESLRRIEIQVALDLNDIHEGNIMIHEGGSIVLVDEDAFAFRVKGIGLANLLKKMHHEDQVEEFLAGYNEIASGDYFTPAYIHHLQIVEAVRTIYAKVRKKRLEEQVPSLIKVLRDLIKAN